jgi:hypothetical protein
MINENKPTPRSRHIDVQHFATQEWRSDFDQCSRPKYQGARLDFALSACAPPALIRWLAAQAPLHVPIFIKNQDHVWHCSTIQASSLPSTDGTSNEAPDRASY